MRGKLVISCLLVIHSNFFTSAIAEELSYRTVGVEEVADIFSLNETSIRLSYLDNLENFKSSSYNAALIEEKKKLLRSISSRKELSFCDRVLLSNAFLQISINEGRSEIASSIVNRGSDNLPEEGIIELGSNEFIYNHFVMEWLGGGVDPHELFAFGMEELAKASADYRRVRNLIDARGERESPTFTSKEIQAHLEAKGETVNSNLHKAFRDDYNYSPIKIIASNLGEDFPVAGYYNAQERAFYFNQLAEQKFTYQFDWLYLHEAIPGHHFQSELSENDQNCQMPESQLSNYVFSEGWGAYVETLGEDLGLYVALEEKLSSIEWNLVRSARVALDVGINYFGWSDADALDFWNENLPAEISYAEREISRIRNWPAQVLTYKYGAAKILEARETYFERRGEKGDLKEFHDLILRGSNIPIDMLNEYIEVATSPS